MSEGQNLCLREQKKANKKLKMVWKKRKKEKDEEIRQKRAEQVVLGMAHTTAYISCFLD